MQQNREYFKAISSFADYEISNHGRARSTISNEILPQESKKGYKFVKLGSKRVRVHRLVAEAFTDNPNNYPIVDHIDKQRDNNNVQNLRWCTPTESNRNRGKQSSGHTSVYKGVFKRKGNIKFSAMITVDGKKHYLGSFTNEIDAATIYNEAAKKYHKSFASLNVL